MANTTGKEGDYTKSGGSVDALYVFLAALNILLSITTSLSNALILIAFRKVTSIYPPTKLLFQCLAVTDICVGLVSQPLYVIYFLSLNTSLDSNWHVLFSIFNVTSIVVEAVLMLISTAISVDRLVALFMGLRYRHVVTLRRVRALITCVWILSCALAALIQFGKEKIHSITLNFFLILIILCILASIICYTKIYLRLRYRQIQLQENQQQQGQPFDEGQIPLNIARYKKIVSSIAGVQLALLICYLPHTVLNILSFHDVLHVDLGRAIDVTFSFLFLNSTLNPILYCWKIKEVRQAVKDTIRFNCCPSSSG